MEDMKEMHCYNMSICMKSQINFFQHKVIHWKMEAKTTVKNKDHQFS